MKIRFELKKGGIMKWVFLLLSVIVALSIVFGQSFYVNWINPSYPPGQPATFGTPTITATQPSHTLQSISVSSALSTLSVDSNANGIIDNSEYSQWAGVATFANDSNSVKGFVPSQNVIHKGCVILDTGLQSGGDSWRGSTSLDLRISNNINLQAGGNPPLVQENICEDGDGCTYNIIKYSKQAGAPNNVFSNSPRTFFQMSSASTQAWWIDAGGSTTVGANGDSIKKNIASWSGANNKWVDINDDDSAVETSKDHVTVQDFDNSNSFIVYFCD